MIEEGPREQRNQLFSVLGSLTDPEEEESKDSSEVNSMRSLLFDVASVDIKLPRRRSLQVEFSCNSCGERTKRLINRLAYERGIVFVQVYQSLDFRKETSKDSSDIVRRKLETLGCDSQQEESSQYSAEPHCYSSF
ncbi:hypothetical protein YC2023_115882 [Brassica napus]